ncbi:hypothetical protein J7K25_06900 [bacterium]|nr:hypothetical protein [bacterium]
MSGNCLIREILNFGYGSMRYFSKNAKKIFEEIKEEAKKSDHSDFIKICEKVREIPKTITKRFIKNLGFITEEDLKENKKK